MSLNQHVTNLNQACKNRQTTDIHILPNNNTDTILWLILAEMFFLPKKGIEYVTHRIM